MLSQETASRRPKTVQEPLGACVWWAAVSKGHLKGADLPEMQAGDGQGARPPGWVPPEGGELCRPFTLPSTPRQRTLNCQRRQGRKKQDSDGPGSSEIGFLKLITSLLA